MASRTEAAEKHVAEVKAQAMGEVEGAAKDVTGDIVELLIGARPSDAEIVKAVSAARAA